MDSQTTELIGRNRLQSELLHAGLEVAVPARDRGFDLIAYVDLDQDLGQFVARPIQMKTASARSFGIWKKYLRIHDLILAFVWNLDGMSEPETYALTCCEAISLAEAMGWTRTASWTEKGAYSTTAPSRKLLELLAPYRMSSERWWEKITTRTRTVVEPPHNLSAI